MKEGRRGGTWEISLSRGDSLAGPCFPYRFRPVSNGVVVEGDGSHRLVRMKLWESGQAFFQGTATMKNVQWNVLNAGTDKMSKMYSQLNTTGLSIESKRKGISYGCCCCLFGYMLTLPLLLLHLNQCLGKFWAYRVGRHPSNSQSNCFRIWCFHLCEVCSIDSSKMMDKFPISWTSTGYFLNSTGSSATNRRFFPSSDLNLLIVFTLLISLVLQYSWSPSNKGGTNTDVGPVYRWMHGINTWHEWWYHRTYPWVSKL